MVRASIAAAASSILACMALAGPAKVPPIWEGQMTQYDSSGTKTYPVRLTRLGDSVTSEYPTLKCSGSWKLIATHGDYKIYQESITYGRLMKGQDQGCIDGIVTFRDGWKEAQFGWFASFEGEPTSAWAVVRPVSK